MTQDRIKLTIDDRPVEVEPGTTVLEAARRLGIRIPALCHHDALEPVGACRLCLVEVDIQGRRRLMASCALPAADGLTVYTGTEAVLESRRLVAELLLARCSQNPRVVELCRELGVVETPFRRRTEDCVLCGRCVRMCHERMRVGAINFVGRGADRRVAPPFDEPSPVCMTCGACESVCPTGGLGRIASAGRPPTPLLSRWDEGLRSRSAAYIPFPQAVPLSAVIDPEACAHVLTGECRVCETFCEAGAIDFERTDREEEIEVGSVILATGYDLMDAARVAPYGYGRYPNVYTSLEFERLSNATGPTGGRIRIRDEAGAFTRVPESAAILHCVGSRDVNYHEYCSRVCCMYALKYSHLLKEKVGHHIRVYDFYIDQRCYGKGYEEFYRRCQEEGTVFVRGKVAEITDRAEAPDEAGKLVAVAEDTLTGRRLRVPVDMVILCAAMEARGDAAEVGRIFGVNLGADGFFLEEHPKLGPLDTATDGVFLAGACQSPKDIPDTVAQASGAAAKAMALASRGRVTVPSAIAWIDPDICAGCQICIGLCPYGAIEFDGRRRVSVVNEAVCKGCGSCAGFCPSDAAQVRHFNGEQVFAELDGLFDAIGRVGI